MHLFEAPDGPRSRLGLKLVGVIRFIGFLLGVAPDLVLARCQCLLKGEDRESNVALEPEGHQDQEYERAQH